MPVKTKPCPAHVFLVEDHGGVRQQIAARIERESDLIVCGQAEDADTALAQIAQTAPDLVLVDLSLKNSSGFHLLAALRVLHPRLPALVLSMHASPALMERARQAGACGYLTKQEAIVDLLAAIRVVLSGASWRSELQPR